MTPDRKGAIESVLETVRENIAADVQRRGSLMATGPEHYAEAERLLGQADRDVSQNWPARARCCDDLRDPVTHPCMVGGTLVSALAPGDAVVYTPYDGAPAEDGVVTRLSNDPSLVFVRYTGLHPQAGGQATPIHRLRRATAPSG